MRQLGDSAEAVLVNPSDYFLYVPLLPEVAAGILDPRRVAVSLPGALPDVRLAPGTVHTVDLPGKAVTYQDVDGHDRTVTYHGRLMVEPDLSVPGQPGLWACGDAAAVPDLTRPGEVTAMTAQHAQRQGARVGKNIAAALGRGKRKPYRHRNLGFVVDLGGFDGAADPLGVPLGGFPAKVVTRGYHLSAMPGNRVRTAIDRAEHATLGAQTQRLDLVRGKQVIPLDTDPPN